MWPPVQRPDEHELDERGDDAADDEPDERRRAGSRGATGHAAELAPPNHQAAYAPTVMNAPCAKLSTPIKP